MLMVMFNQKMSNQNSLLCTAKKLLIHWCVISSKIVTCRPDGEVDTTSNNAFLTQASVDNCGHLPVVNASS